MPDGKFVAIARALQLNDAEKNDKDETREIITKCFKNIYLGFTQTLGKIIYVKGNMSDSIRMVEPHNQITHRIELMSKLYYTLGTL